MSQSRPVLYVQGYCASETITSSWLALYVVQEILMLNMMCFSGTNKLALELVSCSLHLNLQLHK